MYAVDSYAFNSDGAPWGKKDHLYTIPKKIQSKKQKKNTHTLRREYRANCKLRAIKKLNRESTNH